MTLAVSIKIDLIMTLVFEEKKAIYIHYENMPMQYREIFKVVKNENFQ